MSVELTIDPAAPHRDAGWWGVRASARIGPDRLLLVGSFRDPTEVGDLILTTGIGDHSVAARVWTFEQLSVLVVRHDDVVVDVASSLYSTSSRWPAHDLSNIGDDLGEVMRSGLASLPPAARAELLAFLVDTCAAGRSVLPISVAHTLHLARQSLRPRMASAVIDAGAHRGMKIEVIAAVDSQRFYIRGWVGHATSRLVSFVAVSPEGARTELISTLYRYRRDDVAHFYDEDEDRVGYGFAAYAELDAPTASPDGWLIEAAPIDGPPVETIAGTVIRGIMAVRDLLVGDLAIERLPLEEFRRTHLAPAITRILEEGQRRVEIRRLEQFGTPPRSPAATIVVPLYRRVDFVEHQLAQFVHDPEISAADLLYVLDSPELGDGLVAECRRLHRLYEVPFRLAVLSHNGGFSTANNLGASEARGRLLVLMNSDVLPDRPGWLGQLADCYDILPHVGVIGPKLVYEDESIQHAGMYFERQEGDDLWSNEHYFKGFHRSFPPASTSRWVPAITAACLMTSVDLYRRFGGLRGSYVQGDFEDSDLCLRMAEAGLSHWYAANVELYHLEGQSYVTGQRIANGEFNRWQHTHLWNSRIEDVMAQHGRRRSTTGASWG